MYTLNMYIYIIFMTDRQTDFSLLGHVLVTGHLLRWSCRTLVRANKRSYRLSETSNSVQCKQLLCSLSGGTAKALWRVFQGQNKKKHYGTSNNTEGTAAVDLALSRLQSCVNVYKSTLQIQRDTSVTGVGPPWPYRPPNKHWSPPKPPVSSWGL